MKHRIALIALALALGACASSPTVRTLADPSLDISRYRTFAFADPLGTDRQGYQSVVSSQLKSSTRREMEARGFVHVDSNPDLMINFGASLDDKLRVSTYSEPVSAIGARGYYGYRGGFYQPWPQYAERTDVRQYKEGTLSIDLVDATRKQLVWETTITQPVQQSDDLSSLLDGAVKAGMAKLPGRQR